MMFRLIELKNGFVTNIVYDEDYSRGCETCDFGSSYINEVTFIFDCGLRTRIDIKNMYEYALNEGVLMKILLNNTSYFKDYYKKDFKKNMIELINENKNKWLDDYDVTID